MGGWRHAGQRTRDEVGDVAPKPKVDREAHRDSVGGRLATLQRSFGNTAVTAAIQRKDRAQSTDAPGAKKGKKPAPKKEAPKKTYWPAERKYPAESTQALIERAQQDMKSSVKNDWISAKDRFEDVFLVSKSIEFARFLSELWGRLGDQARKEFWQDVFQKKIKPFEEYPPPGSQEHA